MAEIIAYIDGFNLYHGLRDRYQHRYLWLDVVQLVGRLRPRDSVIAVRYFTAIVRNDPPAQARQLAYLDALRAKSGSCLQIIHGRYQAKQQQCRSCGATWTSYEEKETDVNIAVSLVADAASSSADLALLISADSDLCPAIRTARVVTAARQTRFGIIAASAVFRWRTPAGRRYDTEPTRYPSETGRHHTARLALDDVDG